VPKDIGVGFEGLIGLFVTRFREQSVSRDIFFGDWEGRGRGRGITPAVEMSTSPSLFNIYPPLDKLEENRICACWLIWHPGSTVSGRIGGVVQYTLQLFAV